MISLSKFHSPFNQLASPTFESSLVIQYTMKKLLTASVILTSIGMQAQVGIGTTSPQEDLHVVSSDSVIARFEATNPYLEIKDNGFNAYNAQGAILFKGANDAPTFGIGQNVSGAVAGFEVVDLITHSSRMFFRDNGFIGFGTTLPKGQLQVAEVFNINSVSGGRYVRAMYNPTVTGGKQFQVQVDGTAKLVQWHHLNSTTNSSQGTSGVNFARFSLEAPLNSFCIDANGGLGLGYTSANGHSIRASGSAYFVGGLSASELILGYSASNGHALRANGSAFFNGAVTATGYVTSSDARLKSNVNEVLSGSEILSQLRPVEYDKSNFDGTASSHEFGFIAQEVREILPELVHGEETDSTYLSLDYNSFIAILTAANQEQIKANRELTLRVEELENAISVKSSNNQASLTNILTVLIGASIVFTLILTRRKKVSAAE